MASLLPQATDLVALLALAAAGWLIYRLARRLAAFLRERPARLAARRRAEALLGEFLVDAERTQLRRKGYLEVPSPGRYGRVYRVPGGRGPVAVYQRGRLVQLLCLKPTTPLPAADVILAHKLMIEADEEGYLRLANPILND